MKTEKEMLKRKIKELIKVQKSMNMGPGYGRGLKDGHIMGYEMCLDLIDIYLAGGKSKISLD